MKKELLKIVLLKCMIHPNDNDHSYVIYETVRTILNLINILF